MSDTQDLVMKAMRDLPQLPVAVQKLLAVMRDENSSADDVTQVLSSDQALAGKILKLVNSSFYGMSGEVSTITRAVVVLGFSGVRNVAMGFGMVSVLVAGNTVIQTLVDEDKRSRVVSDAWYKNVIFSSGTESRARCRRASSQFRPEDVTVW